VVKDWTVVVKLYAQPDEGEGMTADKARLTLAIVEALKNKGLSQSDIAREYGVTRQYVSWIKRTYGGRLTPRETVLQQFPFKVSRAQGQTSPFRRLRDHAEFVATSGVGMSEELKRLRTFTGGFGTGTWSWSSIRTSRPSVG
jgi:transposase-like protein